MADTALANAHAFGFSGLSSVSMEDLDGEHATGRGYLPGGIFFANSPYGARLVQYIHNRLAIAVGQGALLSSIGDFNGITQVTASGAAAVNTRFFFTTSGLTAGNHVGGTALCQNSLIGAGTPPEGEEPIVAANTATRVDVESAIPYSATITSGDTINLCGTYGAEGSADGDQAYVVLGAVAGRNGIQAGNFGWVTKQGLTPNTLVKAATALTQNDAVVADSGRVGPGGADAASLRVGIARHVMQADSVSDRTTILFTLGFGVNPGA